MTNIPTDLLRTFVAVVDLRSFTQAATSLGVTQPAVSRFLAQTEALAGFALFERTRGRLVPTAKAEALYAETERLFAGAEQVNVLCERLRNEQPRPIVLAAVPTLTFALLPAVMRQWQEGEGAEPF